MKTVLYEATGDLVSRFSIRMMMPSPGAKPPEIEMQVRQATPMKLDPNSQHLFADKRIVLGEGGELEIWGYVATGFDISVEPPFGKRRHRRGWCSL